MSTAPTIRRFSGKFVSKELEAEFNAAIRGGNLRHNFGVIAIALPLNALYALFDPHMLVDADFALQTRLAAFALSTALLCGFATRQGRRRHEWLAAAIMLVLGAAMNAIMWNEPNLANNYYVGLIQGGVFISFLLRLSLPKLLVTLAVTFATFVAIAYSKGQPDDAALQTTALATMYAICAFGAYLFERHRRTEFAQARTIATQNAQLGAMLEDVRLDNERKLAAMNVLVHFVKTPIHQIVGFTGLIADSLKSLENAAFAEQIEHAEFVRRASADLSANVAKLLTYYRLDEQVAKARPERTSLKDMLEDLRAALREDFECVLRGDAPDVLTYAAPLQVALGSLAEHFRKARPSWIEITVTAEAESARLRVVDNASPLSKEAFLEQIKPLTRIDAYLQTDGSAMPMALRTVARAIEICGGEFRHAVESDQNVFAIVLPNPIDKDAKAA
jgi:signal transduction histidine kinase